MPLMYFVVEADRMSNEIKVPHVVDCQLCRTRQEAVDLAVSISCRKLAEHAEMHTRPGDELQSYDSEKDVRDEVEHDDSYWQLDGWWSVTIIAKETDPCHEVASGG